MKNLKYILMAAVIVIGAGYEAAYGADIPRAPNPPPNQYQEVLPIWRTGPYVGANLGYGWTSKDTGIAGNTPFANAILASGFYPNTIGRDLGGGLVGVRLGYNLMVSQNILVGLAVGYSYSGIKDSTTAGGNLVGVAYSTKVRNIGDALLRVGYANGRLLTYVTGGGTWANVNDSVSGSGLICVIGACPIGASSNVRWGGTVGAGLEYKLSQNVSVYGEYLYSSLGTQTTMVTLPPIPAAALSFNNTHKIDLSRALVGLNVAF